MPVNESGVPSLTRRLLWPGFFLVCGAAAVVWVLSLYTPGRAPDLIGIARMMIWSLDDLDSMRSDLLADWDKGLRDSVDLRDRLKIADLSRGSGVTSGGIVGTVYSSGTVLHGYLVELVWVPGYRVEGLLASGQSDSGHCFVLPLKRNWFLSITY